MLVETISVGVFRCNCIVVACEASRQAIVVDPGDEPERVLAAIHRRQLQVRFVLHTHAHIDHVMGTRRIVDATGARARLHADDRPLWDSLGWIAASYRIPTPKMPPLAEPLVHHESIRFGGEELLVIHTPGHTPGSCCFVTGQAGERLLLSGDTLFRGRIGNVGPGRRHAVDAAVIDAIVASIRSRLDMLGDDTRVIPGHGPETQIGIERRSNPFLCGPQPEPIR